MRRVSLFLDDGGVLNDNRLRGPQWERLVAEYFSPILGGSKEAWVKANHRVIRSIIEPSAWQARLEAAADFEDFERNYFLDWIGAMCDMVGVERPTEVEAVALARDATDSILPEIRASVPGASETIRSLHSLGYKLYTASSATSKELAAHLEPMGILDCFERLYGPDVIGAFKSGPEFYRRALADASVDASEAVVVDDSLRPLEWASSVGMRCVLVSPGVESGANGDFTAITSITELPALLESWA